MSGVEKLYTRRDSLVNVDRSHLITSFEGQVRLGKLDVERDESKSDIGGCFDLDSVKVKSDLRQFSPTSRL